LIGLQPPENQNCDERIEKNYWGLFPSLCAGSIGM
jgi:hypothetical protein